MSWNTITVGDLVERKEAEVKTGPFGTQLRASDYVETGTPVINVRNIGFGSIRHDKLEYIPDDVVTRLSGHLLRKGDIVFGRKGAVERHVYITAAQDRWFQGSDCLRLRLLSEENVLSKYLSFTFLTHEHQSWMMQQCSHGATMASLNQDIIKRIPLRLPSIERQKTIVDILSAYDGLIENNTRRIEILEEMVRRLYKEWFVHFRFPGHEGVRFKESELGEIPEGWEVIQLSEVSEYISRGISPKYAQSDCRVINQKCIRDNRLNMALSREQVKKVPEAKYVRFGDVLINSTGVGTLGRVAQVYEPLENTTVDSHVTIVRPLPEIDFDFFGIGLQILQPYFEGLGVGATGQTELSRVRVGETPVIVPPAELQKKFGELVEPMRRACIKYGVKNTNLRAQRDLLLPKLVSGEIDVSDIIMPDDKEVEAA